VILAWFRAFLLTQAVEMGVYVHATGARPLRERLAIAFGASAITHPLVWFVIVEGVRLALRELGVELPFETAWWTGVAVAEVFAVLGEAVWLALFGVRALHALGYALLANGASFTFGLFLYQRSGW
jgi:hypothetical protein